LQVFEEKKLIDLQKKGSPKGGLLMIKKGCG
jgi:hypothetical protein